jgi:hypothetical protein
MSKELKGNAKKYVLLDKITKNISKYKGQLCAYNVKGMTANDLIAFKKKLPNDIKLMAVPTKIGLFALKNTLDVSESNLKGNICIAFADDALNAVAVSSMIPKPIRSEFVLCGISWNGKLNTSSDLLSFLSDNKVFSLKNLREKALFNMFKTNIQFKNLLKIRADML